MSADFWEEANRLIDWCKSSALPLWAEQGVDSSGAFHEQLSMQGVADEDCSRRTRVQCRQIYVFAQAHLFDWYPGADKICDRATELLLERALIYDGDGRFDGLVSTLDPQGRVEEDTRDLYTHAFFLFALAWRARAFGDKSALDIADATLEYLDRKLLADNGGWIESLPPALPRRQNPHMHLLEAFLALYDGSGDTAYLERADQIIQLFERYFLQKETGNILEFFAEDWTPDRNEGHIVEPGHLMEWSWLVHQYGAARSIDMSEVSRNLYNRALSVGRESTSGLLIDRVDIQGGPIWKRRRLWPQTEFIKAAIIMYELEDRDALDLAANVVLQMRTSYLDTPVPGGWRDRYDEYGLELHGPMPASSMYHLMVAISELHRVVDSKNTQP